MGNNLRTIISELAGPLDQRTKDSIEARDIAEAIKGYADNKTLDRASELLIKQDEEITQLHTQINRMKRQEESIGAGGVSALREKELKPTMFWDSAFPEEGDEGSIHNVLNERHANDSLAVGQVIEIMQAHKLPNVLVRVTAAPSDDADEIAWEVVDGQAAQESDD